jgi:hypothetical protein
MRSGAFGRLVAALILLALAACGGIQAAPESPIANFEDYLVGLQAPYTSAEVVACLWKPRPDPADPAQGQRACRDVIVQALMIAIDLRYAQFELKFFDSTRSGGFIADLATLGLTAAGGAIPSLSQELSITAAGVIGTREAFRREVLVEQTSGALLTAMNARRAQYRTRIYHGLRRSAIDYPLAAALADVYAYYRAGTIPGALQGVAQAVGTERNNAERNLEASLFSSQPPPLPPLPPVGGLGAPPPVGAPSGTAPASPLPFPPAGGFGAPPPVGAPSGAAPAPPPPPKPSPAKVRPAPPPLADREPRPVVPPPPSAEISEAEFLQLRDVFGLNQNNAPLKNRERAPAFRTAVRAFHHCKNPSLPEVQQSGTLTPEEKRTALANTDDCLAKVRNSRGGQLGAAANPTVQPSPPGAGAQPGPTNPPAISLPPPTR